MGKSRSHQKSRKSPRGALRGGELRIEETAALLDSARAVLEYRDFATSAHVIFDCCKRLTGAVAGYVAILSADGAENEVVHLDPGGLPCTVDPDLPMPIRGLRAEAYHTGQVVYDNHFASSKWMKYMPEGHAVLECVLFAPLMIKGKAVGLLGLANKPGGFTDDDVRITKLFSEFAALALHNSKTLDALETNEARYRRLYDEAPNAYFSVGHDGYIRQCNIRAGQLLGCKPEALIGRPVLDLYADGPTGKEKAAGILERFRVGKSVLDEELQMQRADGSLIWINLSVSPIKNAESRVIESRSVVIDITERKQAEEALSWEASVTAALSALYEPLTAPQASIAEMAQSVLDQARVLTGSAHGVVSAIDPVTADNVCYTLTHMLEGQCQVEGEDQRIVFPRGSDGRYPALWGEALNTRKAHYTNTPAIHPASAGIPKGHIPLQRFLSVPVLLGEELVGQIMLANPGRDYTKRDLKAIERLAEFYALAIHRKRAEQEIELWAAFPRENPHPVLALKPNGTVDHMNLSAQSYAEKIGQVASNISAILPPDVADIVADCLRKKTGRPAIDVSVGDTVLSWSFHPLASGQFVYAYGYDISKRKRAEKALEAAMDELESRVLQRTAELTKTAQRLENEIAERKQAEKELRFSEARLRDAQRVAQMGSWDWNIQTNDLHWSDEIYHIFGLTPNKCDMTYTAFLACVHPEDRGFVEAHVDAAVQNNQEYSIDHRIIRPDGEIRYVHEQGEVTHDAKGNPIHMLGIVIDITARKRAEEKAHQHLAELAHVSRLSTMGEMATAIAHELNQPLTAILSSAQACQRLMQAEPCDCNTMATAMGQVAAQAKRAGEIIRRLKDFSRKRRFHRSTIDINRVVREAVGFLAHESAKVGVQVRLDLGEPLPAVMGDTIEVEQVIVNLVRNGFEAMHDTPARQRRLTIQTSSVGSEIVEIAVSDRGHGLPEDSADSGEQFFEAFFTTKSDGTGIGLSISRSIIEAYGGCLWAVPNPKGGMTFRFTLPAAMGDM